MFSAWTAELVLSWSAGAVFGRRCSQVGARFKLRAAEVRLRSNVRMPYQGIEGSFGPAFARALVTRSLIASIRAKR